MRRTLAVAGTLVLTLISTARAGTIYDDGGTHTLAGPASDVSVTNGTTLNVVAGADITTVTSPIGLAVLDSNLSVTGGTFAGRYGLSYIATGTTRTLDISGGTFSGYGSGNLYDGPGASIRLNGTEPTATISGGTFQSLGPATDVALSLAGDRHSSITISGGTFLGGARAGTGTIGLLLYNQSSVTFLGTSLAFARINDPHSMQQGNYYHLTGTLASGDAADLTLRIDDYQFQVSTSANGITFIGLDTPILPAPASLVMLATGLIPVAFLVRRSRRRGRSVGTSN